MACPDSIIRACDFPQFLVDQTPKFDEIIMEDIRPTDGWLLNVSTGTTPMGTPVEITQDRFRSVFPNVTKTWTKRVANGPGCTGAPCDPAEHLIGWGADRLTYCAKQQTWATPLMCYDQDMHITHAKEHLAQIISEILRPATIAISSNFLRKAHLEWAGKKWQANSHQTDFTFTWTTAGPNNDDEIYFDCTIDPNDVFLLVPQMLQNRFNSLMLQGYGGANPFKETAPYIELVTDMDTCWSLDKLGGSVGIGGTPSVSGNWRFTEWGAANAYWRYGFSGQVGNYMVRVDPMQLRFNYVTQLVNGLYRYQVVLPYRNYVTTGSGSAAGLGSDPNPDYDKAQFCISQIHHKKGMELLVPNATQLNSQMPYGSRDFGGKWQFQMHDLGADACGAPIKNAWQNKGRFAAWFVYYVRPLQYKFMEAIFHKREQFCIPEINTCSADPGYPSQDYGSVLPHCDLPENWPTNDGPMTCGVLPESTLQSDVIVVGPNPDGDCDADTDGNPDDQ